MTTPPPAIDPARSLTAPALTDADVIGRAWGVRPCRHGGPRFEVEPRPDGVTIIHNYGHGGAGVTLSWGAAHHAADAVAERLESGAPVAIAGAGVIGLSTAILLLERGYDVTIHARDLPPHTTSNIAAAMWWPVATDRGESDAARTRFDTSVLVSWRRFRGLVDQPRYGVERMAAYIAGDIPHMVFDLPDEIMREANLTTLDRAPFDPRPGRRFETWRVETPKYLAALLDDVRAAGGRIVERTFAGVDDFATLGAPVVVNCLGLGAASVARDSAMFGVRGQLVKVRPQAAVNWIAQFDESYLIPRSDGLMLGGTWDEIDPADADVEPPAANYDRILAAHRAYFSRPEHHDGGVDGAP